MRIIGLDIGEKRIGVSLADTSVKIASPHTTIVVDGTELDQIKKLMAAEDTNLVVVGLPRNSKGLETAQTKIVRLFATRLQSRGARVKFQDESLTSVIAERRLKDRKKPYRKEDVDAEAAAIILQDFIEGFNNLQSIQALTRQTRVKKSEAPTREIRPDTPSPAPIPAPTVATAPTKDEDDDDITHKETLSDDKEPEDLRQQSQPDDASSDHSEHEEPAEDEDPEDVQSADSDKKENRKTGSLIASVLIVTFISILSAASIWFTSAFPPAANIPLRQPFTIVTGQSTLDIADNLAAAGLIKSPMVFTLTAKLSGASIPAGTHFLSPSENLWQILDQLTSK